MRDHIWSLLAPKYFYKWKQRHQVRRPPRSACGHLQAGWGAGACADKQAWHARCGLACSDDAACVAGWPAGSCRACAQSPSSGQALAVCRATSAKTRRAGCPSSCLPSSPPASSTYPATPGCCPPATLGPGCVLVRPGPECRTSRGIQPGVGSMRKLCHSARPGGM